MCPTFVEATYLYTTCISNTHTTLSVNIISLPVRNSVNPWRSYERGSSSEHTSILSIHSQYTINTLSVYYQYTLSILSVYYQYTLCILSYHTPSSEEFRQSLEKLRERILLRAAIKIQAEVRMYICRKHWPQLKFSLRQARLQGEVQTQIR